MSDIKDRAKALAVELQKLVDDAMEAGEEFTVKFKAPGPGWERRWGDTPNYSKNTVGFSLSLEEDYEEDDEGNEVVKNVYSSSPTGAWYSSSIGC